jgi:hypothetical protein
MASCMAERTSVAFRRPVMFAVAGAAAVAALVYLRRRPSTSSPAPKATADLSSSAPVPVTKKDATQNTMVDAQMPVVTPPAPEVRQPTVPVEPPAPSKPYREANLQERSPSPHTSPADNHSHNGNGLQTAHANHNHALVGPGEEGEREEGDEHGGCGDCCHHDIDLDAELAKFVAVQSSSLLLCCLPCLLSLLPLFIFLKLLIILGPSGPSCPTHVPFPPHPPYPHYACEPPVPFSPERIRGRIITRHVPTTLRSGEQNFV